MKYAKPEAKYAYYSGNTKYKNNGLTLVLQCLSVFEAKFIRALYMFIAYRSYKQ